MKIKKIFLICVLILICIMPGIAKAETQEEQKSESETNYNIISTEQAEEFKKFIDVNSQDQKLLIFECVLFLIVILIVVKSRTIDVSMKLGILIAAFAVMAVVLKYTVTGNVLYVLDIFIQLLGVILIILSYIFIYKHTNLLVYVPVCVFGIYYSIANLELVKNNIIYQIFLVVAPIALYILGSITEKAKELELLRPVKEKSERKKDENKQ